MSAGLPAPVPEGFADLIRFVLVLPVHCHIALHAGVIGSSGSVSLSGSTHCGEDVRTEHGAYARRTGTVSDLWPERWSCSCREEVCIGKASG